MQACGKRAPIFAGCCRTLKSEDVLLTSATVCNARAAKDLRENILVHESFTVEANGDSQIIVCVRSRTVS